MRNGPIKASECFMLPVAGMSYNIVFWKSAVVANLNRFGERRRDCITRCSGFGFGAIDN